MSIIQYLDSWDDPISTPNNNTNYAPLYMAENYILYQDLKMARVQKDI